MAFHLCDDTKETVVHESFDFDVLINQKPLLQSTYGGLPLRVGRDYWRAAAPVWRKAALSTIDVAILFLFIAVGCSWWVNEGRKHLTELAVDENLQKYGAGLGFDDCSPTAVSRIVPKRFLAQFLFVPRNFTADAIRTTTRCVR